jgi:hypothetical protein
MASKMIFVVKGNSIIEEKIDFTYIKGLSFSQKQNNVVSTTSFYTTKYKAIILQFSIIPENPNSIYSYFEYITQSANTKYTYFDNMLIFNLLIR